MAETTFDWSDMPEETDVKVTYTRGVTIDVESEVPQVLRDKAERSYEKNDPTRSGKTDKDGKLVTAWSEQECGTHERAEAFVKTMRRYAKYRKAGQLTPRFGKLGDTDTKVRFAIKPLEKRETKRLPGSDKKTAKK